jgi:hypothetical protein
MLTHTKQGTVRYFEMHSESPHEPITEEEAKAAMRDQGYEPDLVGFDAFVCEKDGDGKGDPYHAYWASDSGEES